MSLRSFSTTLAGYDSMSMQSFKFYGPTVSIYVENSFGLGSSTPNPVRVVIPIGDYLATPSTHRSIRLLMEKVGLGQINQVISLLKFRKDYDRWVNGGFLYRLVFDKPVYTGTLALDYEPTTLEAEIAASARISSKWTRSWVCSFVGTEHTTFHENILYVGPDAARAELARRQELSEWVQARDRYLRELAALQDRAYSP